VVATTATSFSTLSTLRALRHVRPSVESELVWRGEREGTPAFACLPACQPASPGRPPSRRPEAPAFPSVRGIARAKTRASSRSYAATLRGLFDAGANVALYDDASRIILAIFFAI
ncbi:hypothetical protein DBV15_06724, partial [Temnothorax longispinosus]